MGLKCKTRLWTRPYSVFIYIFVYERCGILWTRPWFKYLYVC